MYLKILIKVKLIMYYTIHSTLWLTILIYCKNSNAEAIVKRTFSQFLKPAII